MVSDLGWVFWMLMCGRGKLALNSVFGAMVVLMSGSIWKMNTRIEKSTKYMNY